MVKRFIQRYDDTAQRIFEVVPGIGIWLLLTTPFWLGGTLPQIAADFIVVLSVFWVYKAAEMTLGLVWGYVKYRRAMSIDWMDKINKLDFATLPNQLSLPKNSKLPKQLIVIPNGGARYEVLEATLNNIDQQTYPMNLIYVCISTEQRLIEKDPEYFTDMHKRLKERFAHWGDRFMITIHPKDLPDEVIGAASNRSWGAKYGAEELLRRGELLEDFLVTSPDEDLRFDKQFFAAASYEYLIATKREQKFYQTAVYLFSNNYWDVPVLIRTFASGVTLPVLSSSAIEPEKRETWSCYTVNLAVMRNVDYWDRTISIDDTPFFWRPFFHFKGDFTCRCFFIPLGADAVYTPKYIQNHRAQYKQLLRWGWGVITFPIAMKGLLTSPEIPFNIRFSKIMNLLEVFVLWKVIVFLITFGVPIIFLINNEYSKLVLSHTIPQTLSNMLLLAMFFLVPSTLIKIALAPKPPAHWPRYKAIFFIAMEIPLNLVVLMTYSFLPYIEATTRMMLGQKYGFVITPKHLKQS